MSTEGFKLDPAHSADCYLAKRGQQDFIVYEGVDWRRKRNGNKGGSTSWHRFRCNCTQCPAILLVRWDVLRDFLAGGVVGDTEEQDA